MKKKEKPEVKREKMTKDKHTEEKEIENSETREEEDDKSFDSSANQTEKAEKTFTPSSEKEASEATNERSSDEDDEEVNSSDRISQLETELVEANEKVLRALAESENVRRRASRDKEDFAKRANANFAKEMLPIADNISRALESADKIMLEENETYINFVKGIEIIEKTMTSALSRQGIKSIEAQGKKFDPRFHEAMYEYDDDTLPTGTVGQVLEVGYTIHDLLLRPAKVGVTKGGVDDVGSENDNFSSDASQSSSEVYEDDSDEPGSHLDEEL